MEPEQKKSIKGTKTEHNLMAAFAGESQARNRYTYYASVAKKEGYEQISAIFLETADNEKEHAKRYFDFLESDHVQITATYPLGYGDTAQNLKAAAMGENEEWTYLYPSFGDIAEEEGFMDVARTFRAITQVEKRHERRYLKLLNNIETQKVFTKDNEIEWKCRNCGNVHKGVSAPQVCPACLHPQSYYEVFTENY